MFSTFCASLDILIIHILSVWPWCSLQGLNSAHTRGLVRVTSSGDELLTCELPIFFAKITAVKFLPLRLAPWIQTVCSSKPFGVRIFISVAKIMFSDFLRRIVFNLEISVIIYYPADYLVVQLTLNSGAVLNKGNFGLRILTTPTRWIKRNNPPSLFKNNIAKHVTFRRYSPPMWNKWTAD